MGAASSREAGRQLFGGLLTLKTPVGALDEFSHDGGPALVVQFAGGDTFKCSLRHRRCLQKGVEDPSCPRLDLPNERRRRRILPASGRIETIETQRHGLLS